MGITMRKLILGTASILALGIGGAALDYVADTGEAAESASTSPTFEASHALPSGGNLSKDNVRWAQLELRNRGLYSGSLDGVVGPQTKHAIAQFQKDNGLSRTTALDQQTMKVLVGHFDSGQGSSTPPNSRGARPMTSSSGASDLGNQTAPK
jgi:peptidoglycan hydrolase-like protein with peptidoglycan-binding domain